MAQLLTNNLYHGEYLPDYPNLFDLSKKEIMNIEKRCRKQGHISNESNLLDIIQKDLKILNDNNLTNLDIFNTHQNMKLKFHYQFEKEYIDANDTYKLNSKDSNKMYIWKDFYDKNQNVIDKINKIYETLPKNWGNDWSLGLRNIKLIKFNNQNLLIILLTWMGAEICPIEQEFLKEYYAFGKGYCDWLIINLDNMESLWVPDLVPYQIGMFGFFQDEYSEYRLDPQKYINFMNIKPNVKPIKTNKKYIWVHYRLESPMELTHLYNYVNFQNITNDCKTDKYDAYIRNLYDKRIELCLIIKDEEWFKNVNKLNVFNINVDLKSVRRYESNYNYNKEFLILDRESKISIK